MKKHNTASRLALAVASTFVLAGTQVAIAQKAVGNDLPPNPRAGECYARIVVPPRYENVTEQVVKKPASSRIEIVPARYETVKETVTTRDASKRLEVIPATYKTVTERVEIRPASKRLEVIPATYKNVTETVEIRPASKRVEPVAATFEDVTERILVREAYTTWKRGSAYLSSAKALKTTAGRAVSGKAQAQGLGDDVLCLVEIPAEYKTVSRRVEKTPATTREIDVPGESTTVSKRIVDREATTREIEIPAEYTTVTRRVIDTPATTREIEIPGETKQVSVRKLVSPVERKTIEIPAVMGTVEKTKLVSESSVAWRSILCETNATPAKIKQIQVALNEKGHNPGKIDGVLRSDTMRAVNAFQAAKNIPVEPYLTIDTVTALGVSPR
jgi:Putative peptidoglycan binding domain